MSVLNQSGEEQVECPLCMEPLEVDDLNFFPCTCGYQICRFCWHRIRTDENGLCPACRKAYSENPADFTPLSKEQVAQLKAEKKARDQQRKARLTESRKHLASVRVVQKNLVFVVGLPVRLADPEVLRRHEYFGKFGRIHKVVINQSTSYAGSQGPSASAYVTYYKSEDALRAIQSVNNIMLDGRLIKSSLGTTKYCSHFMKNQPCPKPDCMYLHDLGDTEASFTKEQMHQGKHQEYERRLHEQLAVQSTTKTGGTQSGQNGTIQKEAWPSLSRNGSPSNVGTKERKSSISESKPTSQNTSNNKTNSENISTAILNAKNSSENISSTQQPPSTQHSNKTERKNRSSKTKHINNNVENVKKNNTDSSSNTTTTTTTKNQTEKISSISGAEKNSEKTSKKQQSEKKNNTEKLIEKTDSTKSSISASSSSISTTTSVSTTSTSSADKQSNDNELSESDRSSDASPIVQSIAKMTLYDEDNTSFFSPNTFQKLIQDGESTSVAVESTSQPSNILNDSLPDINSSEDWEAAFGFTNKTGMITNVYSTDNSPGSSTESNVSVPNRQGENETSSGFNQFTNTENMCRSNEVIDGNVHNRGNYVSNNGASVFAQENVAYNQVHPNNRPSEPAPVMNGLDQQMYKFFVDFHKNSNKDVMYSNNMFNTELRQNVEQSVLSRHIYQHRLMEKQMNEQQILMNIKNHHPNGTQSPIINNPSNQQNYIGHSGYQQQQQQQQQNFLLQNQINLIQNQHNLMNGDQHNLNLLNAAQPNLSQHSISSQSLLNAQHLLNSQGSNGSNAPHGGLGHNAGYGYGAQLQQQQQMGNGATNVQSQQQQQQQHRQVDDELGFDPFHETQKALAELMETEQVQQNRARLPPPGFSHMNAFGIGVPRPHGSKILPFMSLSQNSNSQQQQSVVTSQQQNTNGWPITNQQNYNQKGLQSCSDWTSLDPAIVSSSRHFPFTGSLLRDQYETSLRNLDFATQQQSAGYGAAAPAPNNGFSQFNQGGQYNGPLTNGAGLAATSNNGSNLASSGGLTNGYTHSWWNSSPNDYQSQIPMPPGFRQNNAQGKTQEC